MDALLTAALAAALAGGAWLEALRRGRRVEEGLKAIGERHAATQRSAGPPEAGEGEVLARLLDHAPGACAALDANGRYLACNRRWRALYDLDDPDVRGVDHLALPRAGQGPGPDAFRRAVSGEVVRLEGPFELPDGRVEPLRWEWRPWQRAGGGADAVLASALPVTREKELEAARREVESRFEASFDAAAIGMALAGVDGRWLQVNASLCGIFGYSGEELAGTPFHEITHPDDLDADLETFRRLVAGEVPHARRETRWFHRDGRVVWVQLDLSRVAGGDDWPLGLLFQVQDVTESRRHREALRDAKERAEEANRSKAEFLANMSHEIRTPLHAILGMTELALEGPLEDGQERWLGRVREAADSLLAIVNDVLDFSKLEAGRFRIEPVEFRLRSCLRSIADSFSAEAAKRGLDVGLDVDPEVPDELVADAGRLRQVLVNLLGNAVRCTPEGGVRLRVVTESDEGPDGVVLRFEVCDTGPGIPPEEQQAIFDAFSQGDTARGRSHGGTGLGLSLSARLVALLGGSIGLESAPGRGSVFRFTIRCARPGSKAAPGNEARRRLEGRRALVVDEGSADAADVVELLGSWKVEVERAAGADAALERIDAGQKEGRPHDLLICPACPSEEGSSLLADAVRARGGPAVAVVTAAGQGGNAEPSREPGVAAHLALPFEAEDVLEAMSEAPQGAEEPAGAEEPSVPQRPVREDGESLTVLLAEDDAFGQELACALLEKWGHRVTVAQDGVDAVEALRGASYDLVLLDMRMPRMSGIETVREIRRLEAAEDRPATPVLALTANVLPADAERCLEAGMDDCVTKPVRSEELRATIERWARAGSRSIPSPETGAGPAAGSQGADGTVTDGTGADAAPEPAGPEDDLPIDIASAREALGSHADFLPRLGEVLLRQGTSWLEQAESALAAEDLETLRRAAHAIQGAAAQMAAGPLRAAASAVEARAAEGDAAGARGTVPELRREAERVFRFLGRPDAHRILAGGEDGHPVGPKTREASAGAV